MVVIIKAGFQSVDTSLFRSKSLSKGKKLLESFHVSNVEEVLNENNNRIIFGVVLRETPGVASAKNNTNLYKVKVVLNVNRIISSTECNCKGGLGLCKHAAAICIYVNTENAFSKTNQPMIWNKPSEEQLQKYQKGCRINSLFTEKESTLPTIYQNVPILSKNHMTINRPLTEMVKAEMRYTVDIEKIEKIRLAKLNELKVLLESLYKLQEKSKEYNSYEILESCGNRLKLKKMTCPEEYSTQYSLIEVDKEKWIEICLRSVVQSESSSWFKERKLRVTCSSKAHEIKTRKDNYEKLAKAFINEKYRGRLTPDMVYGIETEPIAALHFEGITRAKIHHVGLIVSKKQPFLACSPDGITENNGCLELLEIKCPSSCRDSRIVNLETCISEVPYLTFDNSILQLKESHKYFT